MGVRVTNAVMITRKWVKRLQDERVPALWYAGWRTVRIYECQICKAIKQGHNNMYEHLSSVHRKKVDDEHYRAIRRMKETEDDKCVGEGSSEQGVEFRIGDTPQPT